jgi:hypothetical protein
MKTILIALLILVGCGHQDKELEVVQRYICYTGRYDYPIKLDCFVTALDSNKLDCGDVSKHLKYGLSCDTQIPIPVGSTYVYLFSSGPDAKSRYWIIPGKTYGGNFTWFPEEPRHFVE